MDNIYFFKLINLDNMDIKKLEIELNKLKIKYKRKDNIIYIYLKNFNIINFIYNLLLLSIIANIKNIDMKLKLNKDIFIGNKEIGLLIIRIFNNIKNYKKVEIRKNGDISEKSGILNLKNKNCILEDKNKIIHNDLEKFLDKFYMQQLRDIIKLISEKIKNPFLKKYNDIMINNIQLDEMNLDF